MNEAQKRKETPLFSGLLKYFPDALKEVARVSFIGNEQHNKGQPLHWDRSKSQDEADALMRHLTDYASGVPIDTDGVSHLGKVAWRALALLQKDLEKEESNPVMRQIQNSDWVIRESKFLGELDDYLKKLIKELKNGTTR